MQKQMQLKKQKQNTIHSTNSDQPEPYWKGIPAASLKIQQNAKIKHLFQELLANKTLNEGEYQGPALIGGNHTWWDGLLKNATFDIQDSQICFFSLFQNDPFVWQQTVLALLWGEKTDKISNLNIAAVVKLVYNKQWGVAL